MVSLKNYKKVSFCRQVLIRKYKWAPHVEEICDIEAVLDCFDKDERLALEKEIKETKLHREKKDEFRKDFYEWKVSSWAASFTSAHESRHASGRLGTFDKHRGWGRVTICICMMHMMPGLLVGVRENFVVVLFSVNRTDVFVRFRSMFLKAIPNHFFFQVPPK